MESPASTALQVIEARKLFRQVKVRIVQDKYHEIFKIKLDVLKNNLTVWERINLA